MHPISFFFLNMHHATRLISNVQFHELKIFDRNLWPKLAFDSPKLGGERKILVGHRENENVLIKNGTPTMTK